MRSVLLLTASFGAGHNQAAYAVQEALRERGATAEVVDYVSLLNPALRSFAKFSLIQGVQKAPGLYGLFYKSMSRIEPDSPLQRYVNHIGITRIQDYIEAFSPDVIASTFPTPMGVVGELRRHGEVNVPNVAIVTDYTAHRQWFHEYADHYFVATSEVKDDLISYGVDADMIDVFGIPLRRKFSADAVRTLRSKRRELVQQFGLSPDFPIVLLMGGGSGVLAEPGDWETFIQDSGMQYLVVCGQNRRMERRFAQLAGPRVRVYGFTSEIDKLMAASDVIVTKPGGLTLTESMAMGIPMILFKPIPGQEVINADFAVRAGVAVRAQHAKEAQQFLSKVQRHPEILERMRKAATQVPVLGAAQNIASRILDLAGNEVRQSATSVPSEVLMT
ncbi:MGDG synthase family glycosyltransferase [Alicyclobacillus dauci]|uniref:Glycosyltransferase n=1 Tax=Alicyclobacillus dauci TaxID=1475485 RepID=A0ABY6Z885_9BACL|nr:glycosyltransferase [Alicyclobacillus dauci]WAH38797.1 glycosyltransferase [Alicyclobacillus dauci]